MDVWEEYRGQFPGALNNIATCPFTQQIELLALRHRATPYWHTFLRGRHIGVFRPGPNVCTWTARIQTKDKRYLQKALGPALNLGAGQIPYSEAVRRAFEWFATSHVSALASTPKAVGRTQSLNFCPIGSVYTAGHALADYLDWSRIARSYGGHYNNLVMVNHHIVSDLGSGPIKLLAVAASH